MLDGKRAMELYLAGRTDREIAQLLGKEPRHISSWRKRNKLPSNYKTARKDSGTVKEGRPDRLARHESGKSCIGCRYWENGICNYILVNHTRRPCPPGKGCTVREERELWGLDAHKQYFNQLEQERLTLVKTAQKKED